MASLPSCGGTVETAAAGGNRADAGGGKGGTAGTGDSGVRCTSAVIDEQKANAVEAVLASEPCFVGGIGYSGTSHAWATFLLPHSGMGVRLCETESNQQISAATKASAQAALDGVDVSCVQEMNHSDVHGAMESDA